MKQRWILTTNQDLSTHTADILVVDETIASLRILTEILTKAGYNYQGCKNFEISSDVDAPRGDVIIVYEFQVTGEPDIQSGKYAGPTICSSMINKWVRLTWT
jgi:DNA-binding NtrC family response regulator